MNLATTFIHCRRGGARPRPKETQMPKSKGQSGCFAPNPKFEFLSSKQNPNMDVVRPFKVVLRCGMGGWHEAKRRG